MYDDYDQGELAEPTAEVPGCPACQGNAFRKALDRTRDWVSCPRCGDFDIERRLLAILRSEGKGTTRALARRLRETKQEEQKRPRAVCEKPGAPGRDRQELVIIALSELGRFYQPTTLEEDCKSTLETVAAAQDASGPPVLLTGTEDLFPTLDYAYNQAILAELIRCGRLARADADGHRYYVTPEGMEYLRARPRPDGLDVTERDPLDELQHAEGSTTHAYVFCRAGAIWHLRYDNGKQSTVRHVDGMTYISWLLERPGRAITVRELYQIAHPPQLPSTIAIHTLAEDGLVTEETAQLAADEGRADAAVYKEAIKDLQAEIEQAKRRNPDRVAGLEEELANTVRLAAEELGVGGRPRRRGDKNKRAYDTVSKAIVTAFRAIGKEIPDLEQHLRISLQYELYSYCYAPDRKIPWSL